MATEIELKAHVSDIEPIKQLLFDRASFQWAFEKDDTYWFQERSPEPNGLRIRLRREKLTLSDGSEKSSCFVTYKIKKLVDKIEINDEKEFALFSGEDKEESIFKGFLMYLGLKPELSKRKKGWAFNLDGINAELCEVEGLGWFLETEIIAEGNSNEEFFTESRKRLLDLLDSLGIKREAIESRFYSEMLKALEQNGPAADSEYYRQSI